MKGIRLLHIHRTILHRPPGDLSLVLFISHFGNPEGSQPNEIGIGSFGTHPVLKGMRANGKLRLLA